MCDFGLSYYKKSCQGMLLPCLDYKEAQLILKEIHSGVCDKYLCKWLLLYLNFEAFIFYFYWTKCPTPTKS